MWLSNLNAPSILIHPSVTKTIKIGLIWVHFYFLKQFSSLDLSQKRLIEIHIEKCGFRVESSLTHHENGSNCFKGQKIFFCKETWEFCHGVNKVIKNSGRTANCYAPGSQPWLHPISNCLLVNLQFVWRIDLSFIAGKSMLPLSPNPFVVRNSKLNYHFLCQNPPKLYNNHFGWNSTLC